MKRIWLGSLMLLFCLTACGPAAEEPTPSDIVMEETQGPVEEKEKKELPTYSDPITGFYDTLQYDDKYISTDFFAYLETCRAEAWEREAEHIFSYLKENAHPELELWLGTTLEEWEESFYAYMKNQALLDAYIGYTGLLNREKEWGEVVVYGTGFSAGEMGARTERCRYFVETWYDAMTWLRGKTPLDCYAFSPQEELERLNREGERALFSQGEYSLEAPEEWAEQVDDLDNPIDGWANQWLYQDGTTYVMMEDAYMEMGFWEAELRHVYDVFREYANPVIELESTLEEAQESLLSFAPVQGQALALRLYSNAFFGREQTDERIRPGSLEKSERWRSCAVYYRHETLRLWKLLLERLEEESPTWVFAPEAAQEEIMERNFQIKEGRDLWLWGEELLDSPVFLEYSGYSRLKEPLQSVNTYSRSYGGDVCVEVFRDEWDFEGVVLLTDEVGLCQEVFLTSVWHFGGHGGVEVVDADFDGNDDLLLCLGGERGGRVYYAAFLKEPNAEGYRYEPSFSTIPTPKFDTQHQVIWGGSDANFGHYYYAYELVDGSYKMTHYLAAESGLEPPVCREYALRNDSLDEVRVWEYPVSGDGSEWVNLVDVIEDYIETGAVWGGWSWCDPRAYERFG